jgi:hypothetical protein
MQTDIWMVYSNSMHFSDKLSYKILFITSYGLKDINFASFKHLQQFSEKQIKRWDFSHRKATGPGRCPAGPEETDWA